MSAKILQRFICWEPPSVSIVQHLTRLILLLSLPSEYPKTATCWRPPVCHPLRVSSVFFLWLRVSPVFFPLICDFQCFICQELPLSHPFNTPGVSTVDSLSCLTCWEPTLQFSKLLTHVVYFLIFLPSPSLTWTYKSQLLPTTTNVETIREMFENWSLLDWAVWAAPFTFCWELFSSHFLRSFLIVKAKSWTEVLIDARPWLKRRGREIVWVKENKNRNNY